MWSITKHWLRTNSASEGWNSTLNSITGKQQPTVLLMVQTLKEEAELVFWQVKSKEPGKPGQNRRKAYVKRADIILKIWKNNIN
jgi:hypothetical protein